jgi:hypothetical protein
MRARAGDLERPASAQMTISRTVLRYGRCGETDWGASSSRVLFLAAQRRGRRYRESTRRSGAMNAVPSADPVLLLKDVRDHRATARQVKPAPSDHRVRLPDSCRGRRRLAWPACRSPQAGR